MACPRCGRVHFNDPKVAVGVLAERRGRLLLVRRNHEPRIGEWSFASGYVDAGEALEEEAVREAFVQAWREPDVTPARTRTRRASR